VHFDVCRLLGEVPRLKGTETALGEIAACGISDLAADHTLWHDIDGEAAANCQCHSREEAWAESTEIPLTIA
jgi:hypothetical protein